MSDRSYTEIEFRRALLVIELKWPSETDSPSQTLEQFLIENGYETDDDGDGDTIVYYDTRADAGGEVTTTALRKLKIPHCGIQEGCLGAYGPTVFAYDGKNFSELPSLDGKPCILVDRITTELEGIATDFQGVREYYAIVNNVRSGIVPEVAVDAI